MIYPVLTYSRNAGDFSFDLAALHACGLKAIRLIYKGKPESEFDFRVEEILEKIKIQGLNIDILIDLPGSKPIVGDVQTGLNVQSGLDYQITNQDSKGDLSVIPTVGFFTHECFGNLAPGDIISIADDELNLSVKDVTKDFLLVEALNSFHLSSGRSISVKNKAFYFEANSERDIRYVQNLKHRSDNIKLLVSFTKNAADVNKLKSIQPGIEIIPKIETILDETTLIEIINTCQTILLGRGDLSTSSLPNELFIFQKRLIDLCRIYQKKLIIGTGLLASIGDNTGPAIAEVMDYAYLRNMGIEAFLISGSNAHKYPLETLRFMKDFQ